ncbi:MAG: type 4a pilus biogenesis protein PilO [Bdellovibrionales bacterium]
MNNLLTRIAFLTMKQVGIIALVMGFLFYKFMYDDGSDLDPMIAQAQTELSEEQNRKEQTEKTLKTRDKLQDILSKLTERYEELSRQIPTDINDFEINRQLNALIQAARVKPFSRKPMDPVNGPVIVELPYEMRLVGGYNELAQFVYLVSTTERVMVVKGLKMEAQQPYDGRLTFDVKLSAYKLTSASAAKAEAK